ncbi:hypothetical protein NZD89_09325 [Alicyclobacillus fastidiosus]|uniref:Uncharacterized protein n=1 Tax=Alicyclobacillus fastidiosus TaxID=392011 RepID=A0ABY6ZKV2_9BACL|nr:hypothetical protein [Alicyclobacillus fastidiosus]WAH43558.1 hypothetical protein NZD89_09325 [Alicyclobacillus fastidiosus]GMA59735.1 hypothetical protein GCM10025859_01750 [Alicyclobacillus fastidiosus]
MPETVVYGPLELPSGKKIKFRRPNGLDRFNVSQAASIGHDEIVTGTMRQQDYLRAKVITEVDGKAMDGTGYKTLFNTWDDLDIQYYQAVYTEMFGMSDQRQADAKEKAAFLLNNSTSTDGSSSQNPATAPSTAGSPSTTS